MDSMLQPLMLIAGLACWSLAAGLLMVLRRPATARWRRHLLFFTGLTLLYGAIHVGYWLAPTVGHFPLVLLCFEIGTLACLTAVTVASLPRVLRAQDSRRFTELSHNVRRQTEEKEWAEKALRHAEEKYRNIVENAVEGIVQTSSEGKFLVANPAFARMLGYDCAEDLIANVGNNSARLYVRPEERAAFIRTLLTEGEARMEFEAWRKDGATVWLSSSSRTVRDENGGLLYFESIVEDSSDRKKAADALRENRERLQAALTASESGTFSWKRRSDQFECDASLAMLLGLPTQGTIPFQDFIELIYVSERTETAQLFRESLETLRDLDVQFRLRVAGKGLRWISAKGKVFTDGLGTPTYMTGACTDITRRREAEELLRSSEERYRSLVAATSSVVWTSDVRGRFLTPQLSWQRYTGQCWPEQREFGWMQMVHPDDLPTIRQQWMHKHGSPGLMRTEGRLWHHQSQSYRYFEARAVPLRARNGRFREWVGTIVDIHDRKMAVEEETKFKFLSDNANDTYLLVDKESKLAYVNRVASELLGYSDNELMHKSLAELQVGFDRAQFSSLFEKSTEGRIAPFEISLARKDGTHVPVELSVSRLHHGDQTYLFGVARDITERKAVEESLRTHAEELSRSNRELEQFAYVSSHDLKEPLRMVTVYVQMLQNHLGEKLDPQGREYLEYALQGSRRMLALINDLLAYGRVGKELSPFTRVDTENALQIGLMNLKSSIDESNAVVTSAGLPSVLGNASQLTQLLQNLVANAIKFRGESIPRIHISAQRNELGNWVFAVRDNGIGIHPRYLDRIFVIFQRLHTAQKYPGTGIGLSICKKIVENHGGTIWAESGLGQGSTFYFSLQGEVENRQAPEKNPSTQAVPRRSECLNSANP